MVFRELKVDKKMIAVLFKVTLKILNTTFVNKSWSRLTYFVRSKQKLQFRPRGELNCHIGVQENQFNQHGGPIEDSTGRD